MDVKKIQWAFRGGAVTVSAFADIKAWYRADTFTGTTPSVSLTDKSKNGNNAVQAAGTMTPGTAANGQAKFTASSARLESSVTMRNWPCTIITVGKSPANALTGFAGHTGAASTNTLWFGYESGLGTTAYAVNNSSNGFPTANVDHVWTLRNGYGSRVTMVDGIIQADQTQSGCPRSSAQGISLGTQYRLLNLDWYETLIWDRTLSLTELDEVHTYLNTRYALSIPLWSSYTTVPLIAFGGQSNSDGRGDRGASDVNIPVAYRGSLANVKEWDNSTTFSNMNLSTNTYFSTPAVNINSLYIGQELTAAKDYADRAGQTVYVFKYAGGSTSMYYTLADNGFWTEIHDATNQTDTRSYFGNSMKAFWKMMRVFQTNSQKPSLKGYTFYQGEDDATDSTAAGQWSTLGQSFFTASRAEFGLGTAKIFLVRIHASIDLVQQPFRDTVRAQQVAAAAALTSCQLVSVDSYSLRDTVHIDVNGQIALGQFLATQF